jgi:hypothetical protein
LDEEKSKYAGWLAQENGFATANLKQFADAGGTWHNDDVHNS